MHDFDGFVMRKALAFDVRDCSVRVWLWREVRLLRWRGQSRDYCVMYIFRCGRGRASCGEFRIYRIKIGCAWKSCLVCHAFFLFFFLSRLNAVPIAHLFPTLLTKKTFGSFFTVDSLLRLRLDFRLRPELLADWPLYPELPKADSRLGRFACRRLLGLLPLLPEAWAAVRLLTSLGSSGRTFFAYKTTQGSACQAAIRQTLR